MRRGGGLRESKLHGSCGVGSASVRVERSFAYGLVPGRLRVTRREKGRTREERKKFLASAAFRLTMSCCSQDCVIDSTGVYAVVLRLNLVLWFLETSRGSGNLQNGKLDMGAPYRAMGVGCKSITTLLALSRDMYRCRRVCTRRQAPVACPVWKWVYCVLFLASCTFSREKQIP